MITASDPDNTGGANEPLRYADREAHQGNGADSPPKYTGTLGWHAPNAVGPSKLTLSVIDPYGTLRREVYRYHPRPTHGRAPARSRSRTPGAVAPPLFSAGRISCRSAG